MALIWAIVFNILAITPKAQTSRDYLYNVMTPVNSNYILFFQKNTLFPSHTIARKCN
jgi:hypothetical protein